jgi:hypothetical protein
MLTPLRRIFGSCHELRTMNNWRTSQLTRRLIVCLVAACAAGTLIPTVSAQDARPLPEPKCWTDWSEAAVVARRESLTSVERLNKLIRDQHPGAEVIKVTLCEEHGRFVYRLILRERQGQLKPLVLDALRPQG